MAAASVIDGRATLALPAEALPVGEHVLDLHYSGDRTHQASSSTVTFVVNAVAAPADKVDTRTKAKVTPRKLSYRENFKVKVKVKAPEGVTPMGKVTIRIDGRRVKAGTLKNGRLVVKVKRNLALGKHRVVVVYRGDAATERSKDRLTFRVRR